jgi:putative YphP/YqiW family bacilliredoxin
MANYPEAMVAPMREELLQVGFEQLLTPDAVDAALARPGRTLLVLNSVCGCAAGNLRPGVVEAVSGRGLDFDHLVTVFAGMETEAVRRAREHFGPIAPSSPNVALFEDGKLVRHMPRTSIQDQGASLIADEIQRWCSAS